MFVAILCALVAGADPVPLRTHTPTLDDYFSLVTPTEIALSPDGKHLVFLEAGWPADRRLTLVSMRLVEVATGKMRTLLSGSPHPWNVRWTRDGRTILFLARGGASKAVQVWGCPAFGGDPALLTDLATDVQRFDLSPDDKVLYVVREEAAEDPTFAELRREFSALEYGSRKQKSLLSRIERDTGKVETLPFGDGYIHDLAASPDGKRIALITAPNETVAAREGRSALTILDLTTGKRLVAPDGPSRAQAPSKFGSLERLAWSPSGKQLAFSVIYDAFPCEVLIAEGFAGELTTTRVERPKEDGRELHVRGYGSPLAWRSESELCFLADVRARTVVLCAADIRAGKAARWTRLTSGDVTVAALTFGGTTAAYVVGTPMRFDDLVVQQRDEEPRPLTRLNPQVETWQLPTRKLFRWKGFGGVEVEGILELPAGHKPGVQVPLVVNIHGGPTTCDTLSLRWSIEGGVYLASKGYASFYPNYRGSTGYGDAFLLGLNGRENEADIADILSGVEMLVKDGIADPQRLAVMGWSNGGYLTTCAITKTTRFKAAISGAGISDQILEWGTSDEPAYMMAFKQGKLPWQAPEMYHAASPVRDLGKVTTPTLIHVGANDERCPPGHSRLLYRALKDYLRVPTELIVYPDEPHGLTLGKNRRAKMAWDLAWLAKYLR